MQKGIRAWREGGERDIKSCGDIHSHVGGRVGTRGPNSAEALSGTKTDGVSLAA